MMRISMKKMEHKNEEGGGAVEGDEGAANSTTIIVGEAIWLAPRHLVILSILIANNLLLTSNLLVLGCQMAPGDSRWAEGSQFPLLVQSEGVLRALLLFVLFCFFSAHGKRFVSANPLLTVPLLVL